jgi:hypothetical protein
VDAPEYTDDEDYLDEQDTVAEDPDDTPPIITLPDDIEEADPGIPLAETGPLWRDPSDDLISVSLDADRRLKKLARGRQSIGEVGGNVLQERLREQ